MKIIDQFKDAKARLYDTIYRFPFTTIFLSAISLISIYFILASENDTNLLFAFVASTLITFLFELAYEYDVHKIRILSLIIGLVTTFLSYVVLSYFDNIYVNTGLAGICIATISLIFYILYKNKENKYIFSYLIKTYFITSLFSSVVYSGFLVVLLAFNFLIFSFNDVFKLISILAILILFLLDYVLFLSYIPKKDETVVKLSQKHIDHSIRVELDLDEFEETPSELRKKATYKEIKNYVFEKYGVKVTTLAISQIKRKCGLEVGDNYNPPKNEKYRQPQCTPEKEEFIMDALRHFKLID